MNYKRNIILGWVIFMADVEKFNFKKGAENHGKWMYFFKDRTIAETVCVKAIEEGITEHCKYTDDETGVCCFYVNSDDVEAHKSCIQFFLDNNLIARTKTGRLYNISFKRDSQTRNKEYGTDFKADIKLADFVDLETGNFIK